MFDYFSDWSWAPAVDATWVVGLVLAVILAWAGNLVALPGNWLCVAAIGLYVWLGPESGRIAIGIPALVGCFVLAMIGEAFEFAAAALGAKSAGASRRSTFYALIGSVVGALVGAVVGLPVPAIGSILAAILFGGAGAMMGAMYGEWSNGKPWRESWAIGHAAFWGRTFGLIGKLTAGLMILLIAISSLVL